MTFDVKYFATPLSSRITLGELKVEKAEGSSESAFMKTLKAMGDSYRRYWDRIAETGIPARLQ